jgi:hypothetical protein
MKLSDLILAVGNENVQVQNLLHVADSIVKTKRGTKITFYTDAVQAEEFMTFREPKMMALVVWMPRDKVNAAVETAEPQLEKGG